MTFLLFLRRLDDEHRREENKANTTSWAVTTPVPDGVLFVAPGVFKDNVLPPTSCPRVGVPQSLRGEGRRPVFATNCHAFSWKEPQWRALTGLLFVLKTCYFSDK